MTTLMSNKSCPYSNTQNVPLISYICNFFIWHIHLLGLHTKQDIFLSITIQFLQFFLGGFSNGYVIIRQLMRLSHINTYQIFSTSSFNPGLGLLDMPLFFKQCRSRSVGFFFFAILCVLYFQKQSFLTFILLYCNWCCAVWRS